MGMPPETDWKEYANCKEKNKEELLSILDRGLMDGLCFSDCGEEIKGYFNLDQAWLGK
jgi:hypothetical protein